MLDCRVWYRCVKLRGCGGENCWNDAFYLDMLNRIYYYLSNEHFLTYYTKFLISMASETTLSSYTKYVDCEIEYSSETIKIALIKIHSIISISEIRLHIFV